MKNESIVGKLDISEDKVTGNIIDQFKRLEVIGYQVTVYNQDNTIFVNREKNSKDLLLLKSNKYDIGDTIYVLQNNSGEYSGFKFDIKEEFALDTFYQLLNKNGFETKNSKLPIKGNSVRYRINNIEMKTLI